MKKKALKKVLKKACQQKKNFFKREWVNNFSLFFKFILTITFINKINELLTLYLLSSQQKDLEILFLKLIKTFRLV